MYIAVCRFTKDKASNLHLGNSESKPTYLAVTCDRKLTWNKSIENVVRKARRRFGLLRKLAGTN